MRNRGVTPHVARRTHSAIDGRTTRHAGYRASQKVRKRVEVFGWMKTVGGLRRTRYGGVERTGLAGYMVYTDPANSDSDGDGWSDSGDWLPRFWLPIGLIIPFAVGLIGTPIVWYALGRRMLVARHRRQGGRYQALAMHMAEITSVYLAAHDFRDHLNRFLAREGNGEVMLYSQANAYLEAYGFQRVRKRTLMEASSGSRLYVHPELEKRFTFASLPLHNHEDTPRWRLPERHSRPDS